MARMHLDSRGRLVDALGQPVVNSPKEFHAALIAAVCFLGCAGIICISALAN